MSRSCEATDGSSPPTTAGEDWAGDAAGALRLSRALLPDRERVLGPDHPDTLATRGHVAAWTGKAGNDA